MQLATHDAKRRVALSGDGPLRLVRGVATMLDLARRAIDEKSTLAATAAKLGTEGTDDLDRALAEGRLLPTADHPDGICTQASLST